MFVPICNYIPEEVYNSFVEKNLEVGKLINYMINNPQKFGASQFD